MKIMNRIIAAGMIALPLIFAGCASDESPDVAKNEKDLKNIILDNSLQDDIKIEMLRRWKTEHGLINVAVRARVRATNVLEWVFCSYKDVSIAYRFAWFDEKGVEIETPTSQNWFILNVPYSEEVGFGGTSPSDKAKDFKLFIKKLTKENEAQLRKRQLVPEKKQPAAKKAGDEKQQPKKKGTVSDDVKVPPSTPTRPKAEPKKQSEKKGTVADDVKVPPSTPTRPKAEPKKTDSKTEEAEADAASVRQATPAKPVGNSKK